MVFVTRPPEKVTFSGEKMTFTFLKVVFSDEKMTFTILKVTFSLLTVTSLTLTTQRGKSTVPFVYYSSSQSPPKMSRERFGSVLLLVSSDCSFLMPSPTLSFISCCVMALTAVVPGFKYFFFISLFFVLKRARLCRFLALRRCSGASRRSCKELS